VDLHGIASAAAPVGAALALSITLGLNYFSRNRRGTLPRKLF
jgi:hypothetical protein